MFAYWSKPDFSTGTRKDGSFNAVFPPAPWRKRRPGWRPIAVSGTSASPRSLAIWTPSTTRRTKQAQRAAGEGLASLDRPGGDVPVVRSVGALQHHRGGGGPPGRRPLSHSHGA